MRNGPYIQAKCSACYHHRRERFSVQGDSGSDGYCTRFFAHPEKDRLIGSYSDASVTPEWCPELTDAQRDMLFPAQPRQRDAD